MPPQMINMLTCVIHRSQTSYLFVVESLYSGKTHGRDIKTLYQLMVPGLLAER